MPSNSSQAQTALVAISNGGIKQLSLCNPMVLAFNGVFNTVDQSLGEEGLEQGLHGGLVTADRKSGRAVFVLLHHLDVE
jgi:hypothetical protein